MSLSTHILNKSDECFQELVSLTWLECYWTLWTITSKNKTWHVFLLEKRVCGFIWSLLVHHRVLVLLSCNPGFPEQEDALNHSWNTSVAEMARTDPCLENQSVEEIITIAFVSTYLFKVNCAGPVPTAAQTVGRFFT